MELFYIQYRRFTRSKDRWMSLLLVYYHRGIFNFFIKDNLLVHTLHDSSVGSKSIRRKKKKDRNGSKAVVQNSKNTYGATEKIESVH